MTITKTLTPATDLKNIKRRGLGFSFEQAQAGAFIVLEECSHSAPYEIGRFTHTGSPISRAHAFREARTLAGSKEKFCGDQMSYNTYEETAEEPAGAEEAAPLVSELPLKAARTLATTARLVRQSIRKKEMSLKAIRAIPNESTLVNPFYADRRGRQITPALWEHVAACVSGHIEPTCAALLALEAAADRRADELAADMQARDEAAHAPLMMGDKVNDGGVIRTITSVRAAGEIVVIDNITELMAHSVQRIETRGQICARIMEACSITEKYALEALIGADFDEAAAIASVKRAQGYYSARHESADAEAAAFIATDEEPATDCYRLTYAEIVEKIQMEKAMPAGTKPTARGFLALMILREESHLPPDTDTIRDVLQCQLVNVYQHGVITSREFIAATKTAANAGRPRTLLAALREALKSGADIVEALTKAAQ